MASSVQGQALGHKAFSGNGRCYETLRPARSVRAARVSRQIQAAAPKSTGNDVQRGVERFLQVNLLKLLFRGAASTARRSGCAVLPTASWYAVRPANARC